VSSDIERFDHDTEYIGSGFYISKRYSTSQGDYVSYADHLDVVQSLESRICALEAYIEVIRYGDE
jgi:hypothetical protein